MKIKPEYKLRKIGGTNIVVSTAGMDFQGIITVNDTAEFIWRKLENGMEENEIISALASECGVKENLLPESFFAGRLPFFRFCYRPGKELSF